jgi:poly-gamma-glutamate synthase PgsB/CapB
VLYLYCMFLLWCAGLLAAGILEQRFHSKRLHSIPVRVLVNGIRGKSSITRLCTGALRGGGRVVVGKTTGSAARFIYPDGSEEPVFRKFNLANIVEQIGVVRRAAVYYPDALVIECMAVAPALQEITQQKLIQSTIGVLCNVRADHLAEMGPTLADVARSLSRAMPVGGVCVTAEREHIEVLREEAAKRACRLVEVGPEWVSDEEMRGFGWVTFKENVAIALAVAQLVGVDRVAALRGMWAAAPDPGALSVCEYEVGAKRVRVANIFAANDPDSTLINVRALEARGDIARPLHLVINCRPDRVERNGQMGALTSAIDPERIIVIGVPTRSAIAAVPAALKTRVHDLGGTRAAPQLLADILRGVDHTGTLVLVGNIHGQGEMLLDELDKLPEVRRASRPQATPQRMIPVQGWYRDDHHAVPREASRAGQTDPVVLTDVS